MLGGFFNNLGQSLLRLLLRRIRVAARLIGASRKHFVDITTGRITPYVIACFGEYILVGVLHFGSAAIGTALHVRGYRIRFILRRVGGHRFLLRGLLIFCHGSRAKDEKILLLFYPACWYLVAQKLKART